MLTALSIRDIVLIDRLDLEFAGGLSVLSGETGAGKSILLDALSLALGARGDAGLVRAGAGKGSVTAIFRLSSDSVLPKVFSAEHGLDLGDEVVLRRVQHDDGRTRGFLNDEPVSARLLKDLGDALVEIHGQNDARSLYDPAAHLAMIDAFGGLGRQVAAVAAAWRAFRDAAEALAEHEADIAAVARDADFLKASLDELDALCPKAGEERALASERQLMMEGERIAEDLAAAGEALGGEAGADRQLARALAACERAEARARGVLAPVLEALGRASVELEEGRAALDDLINRSEADPARLETVEERLFALRAAGRKHGVEVDDLPALATRLRTRFDAIKGGEERLAALKTAAETAQSHYVAAARALGDKRAVAAARLDAEVMAELPVLRLENARFETGLTALDEATGGPTGLDRAEFLLAANPGSAPAPLRKVASGGELARVMLALKVVLAGTGGAPTMIFDEIDAGVGGAVAHAVGERLARLGGQAQVLVVTHSPQVAARGGQHFLIEKSGADAEAGAGAGAGAGELLRTQVTQLEPAARAEEVARMLAGASVTDEARAAAAKLIAGEP
ncbi:DNA repair protein RecN [hydrothermal vent metagenome]|uniref:DNA repair protein RecN n=1 Tax=hydrothermal vent metagenome TaxID=652676 RepID=A0A3B0TTQ3_9ZZZZ